LASHIGEVRAAWPNKTLWVTELGWQNQGEEDTLNFFNQSTQYLDRLDYVERYAWFGGFRESDSNVGPNGALLDDSGEVDDLGAMYLGGAVGQKAAQVGAGSRADISVVGRLLCAVVLIGTAWVL